MSLRASNILFNRARTVRAYSCSSAQSGPTRSHSSCSTSSGSSATCLHSGQVLCDSGLARQSVMHCGQNPWEQGRKMVTLDSKQIGHRLSSSSPSPVPEVPAAAAAEEDDALDDGDADVDDDVAPAEGEVAPGTRWKVMYRKTA